MIASLVEGDVGIKIHELKEELAKNVGVTRALKNLPHITFHPPFEVRSGNLARLTKRLEEIAARQKAFSIQLSGFDHFEDRVWFVDIEPSEKLLGVKHDVMRGASSLVSVRLDPEKERNPHFHVTLAFQEGDPTHPEKILSFLGTKQFEQEFLVNHLALLQWTGDGWIVDRMFTFSTPTPS